MKKLYSFAWCMFSCISFMSCQSETPPIQEISEGGNKVIYFENLVTKAGDSQTQFRSITSKGNVLVDFFASWCGPCKAMGPILVEISKKYPNIKVVKIDVERFPELASGVKTIPVLRLYKNGRQLYSKPGALSFSQITALIQQYFS